MAIAYPETLVRSRSESGRRGSGVDQPGAHTEVATFASDCDEWPTAEYSTAANTTDVPALTVLSKDPALRAALDEAADDLPIEFVDSVAEVLELAALGGCSLLIHDASFGGSALEQLTTRIKQNEPALVTIAIGTREEGAGLVAMLSRGAIDRFMIKPLDVALARTALRSAVKQHCQLKFSNSVQAESQESAPAGTQDRKLKLVSAAPAQPPREQCLWEKLQDKPLKPVPQRVESKLPEAEHAPIKAPLALDDQRLALSGVEVPTVNFRPKPSWSAMLIAVLAVAGSTWWVMHRPATVDAHALAIKNIADAERAFTQGNYIDPPELSALHFFTAALQLDPNNAQAQRGLDAVIDRLIDGVKDAIIDRDLLRAQSLLDSVRRIRPMHRQLPLLEGQLQKTRDAERSLLLAQIARAAEPDPLPLPAQTEIAATSIHANAGARPMKPLESKSQVDVDNDKQRLGRALKDAAQLIDRNEFYAARTAIAEARTQGAPEGALNLLEQTLTAAQATLTNTRLLELATLRLDQDRLIEPIDDCAKHYVLQLAKRNARYAGLGEVITTLGRRLAMQTQSAIALKDVVRAQLLLNSAREIGFTGPEFVANEEMLKAAREPAVVTPAPVPAPPVVLEAPNEPTLVRYVPAEYPLEARKQGIEGWINVRLAVNSAGNVVDSHVEDGVHRDLFSRAALAAVRQWQYTPASKTMGNFERLITVRVEFKLKA
jgi:TonB family protein